MASPVPSGLRRHTKLDRTFRLDSAADLCEMSPLSQRIFEYLDRNHDGTVSTSEILLQVQQFGLDTEDPRLSTLHTKLHENPRSTLNYEEFVDMTKDLSTLLDRGFCGELCIPNFSEFRDTVEQLFQAICNEEPKLKGTQSNALDPFVVSLCSVDGQRLVMQRGACQEIQMEGCCKPILYSMAMESNPDIESYISHEPSGLDAHAMALQLKNGKKRPHNPLMNTGALLSCALVGKQNQSQEEKLALYKARLNRLFSRPESSHLNSSAKSIEETEHSSRNSALAYLLDDASCFPPSTNVDEVIQLFFQACATSCTVDELSLFASTLANGGLHPITQERIIEAQTVHHCLSVMFSCGLGTYSGEWAFHVGMPALSSLGGAMLVVVPGLMGFCSYSPALDRSNNSVNGVKFFKSLSQTFTLHNFDSLPMINLKRKDPRRNSRTIQEEMTTKLIIAAAEGDVCEVRRLRASGANLNATDYDSRTALHLAASEGKIKVVNYLIKHHAILSPVDRWGGTPMSDAITFGHLHVAQLLTKAGVINSSKPPPKSTTSNSSSRPTILRDMSCFYAASMGDLPHLKASFEDGVDFVSLRDYDGRTPLHLAAAEGRLEIVQFLITKAGIPIQAKDRSQRTPMSEAKRGGHAPVVEYIRKQLQAPHTSSKRHYPSLTVPQTPRVQDEDSDDELESYEVSSHSAFQFLSVSNEIETESSVKVSKLLSTLRENGLLENDPRLKKLVENVKLLGADATLSYEQYRYLTESGAILLEKALAQSLVIPHFSTFCDELIDIFEDAKSNRGGHIATYIPQLANVDPEKFGMALCTVDGQRFHLGDSKDTFCAQSCSKAISYCLAMEELGCEKIHFHMGCEPSGLRFNDLSLLDRGGHRVPHNPMINSGAIMSSSLIRKDLPLHQRFEYVMQTWRALCGDNPVGFDNSVCLSERSTADRNWCLGYMMREAECLPEDTDLAESLEFYFEQCSLTTSCEDFSVLAATLASGGVCPLTNHRVFKAETVRNCLSLMFSCGMYDASGTWGYSVGIPAKSGVSGVLLLVIPNVMGLAVWSPRLDDIGNTVRGVQFCHELVRRFPFHNFDTYVEHKKHPSPVLRPPSNDSKPHDMKTKRKRTYQILYAAHEGNVEEIRRLRLQGADLKSADYDGRTAMHIAASMGHVDVIEELLRHGADIHAIDRWGGTPVTDAERYAPSNADAVVKLLQSASGPIQRLSNLSHNASEL